MRERERHPARWPSQKQARLVCCLLAGFAAIGIPGAVLGWSSAAWDFSTAFGGVGGAAVYWATQVLL